MEKTGLTFDKLFARIKEENRVRRMVVAGSASEHTMQAVVHAMKEGLVTPIFCGDEKKTMELFKACGGDGYDYVMHHCETREDTVASAVRCVAEGDADMIMKGLVDTSQIIGAALKHDSGIRLEGSTVVHALGFAEIETHHKMVGMTDGSICIAPTLEQKKPIIQNCVNAMHKMGWECPKVACLAELLRELNPAVTADCRQERITAASLPSLLPACPLWVEALDGAADKRLLVEHAMLGGRHVVSASGMGGYNGAPMQKRALGSLTLVGDFTTDILEAPPLAPRVTEAAALLADAALTCILDVLPDEAFGSAVR